MEGARVTTSGLSSIAMEMPNKLNLLIRLYKSTWPNPLPDLEIKSIDFVSTMTNSAPLLIAVTAE